MSYEIIYDRKFVKTTRGIVPMTLHGSNNCFDVKCDTRGRQIEVAERYWDYLGPKGSIENDPKELVEQMRKAYADREENYEFCKFHSKWVRYNEVPAWYQAGINRAQTLEDYILFNPYLHMSGELRVYPKDSTRSSESVMHETFRTTAELENWIDRALEEREKYDGEVYTCLSFSTPKPLKSVTKASGPVVAKAKYGYVEEYVTDKSVQYTKDRTKAIVFDSAEDAMKKIGHIWGVPRFISAQSSDVSKTYVIGIAGNSYSGMYIQKRTKNRLRFAAKDTNAMHFVSEKAAQRYIEMLRIKYKGTSLDHCDLFPINTLDAIAV